MTPGPAGEARAAKRALAGLARPAGSFDAARYFRGTAGLGFYNVGTDRVRAMARAIALKISHRVYVMGHGRIVFEGTPADLAANAAVRRENLEV